MGSSRQSDEELHRNVQEVDAARNIAEEHPDNKGEDHENGTYPRGKRRM
jgi:hypothetical protein